MRQTSRPLAEFCYGPGLLCGAGCCCGAGFPACGRLSSRPGCPLQAASTRPNRPLFGSDPARASVVDLATPSSPWSTQSCVPHRMFAWSKPPGLPCRRSRRQSDTIPNGTGVPTPSGPHDCALHLQPLPSSHLRALRGLFFSVSSVPSVVCLLRVLCGLPSWYQPLKSSPQATIFMPPRVRAAGGTRTAILVAAPPSSPLFSPCPLCPLWFAFSVSSVPSVVCLLRVLCGLPSYYQPLKSCPRATIFMRPPRGSLHPT